MMFLDKIQNIILDKRNKVDDGSTLMYLMKMLKHIHPQGLIQITGTRLNEKSLRLMIDYTVGDFKMSVPHEDLIDTYYTMEKIGNKTVS